MEQRKRESLIPKGTFEIEQPSADADRGELSGTFLRPVSEIAPAPVARIELKRRAVPPPPPPASMRPSLRPVPPRVQMPSIVPPPATPPRVPTTTPEPSLRTLVASSYPAPPPSFAEPERVDFQDFAVRLDVPQMAPPPSSLLPNPAESPRPTRRTSGLLLLIGIGALAVGWFSRGLVSTPSQGVTASTAAPTPAPAATAPAAMPVASSTVEAAPVVVDVSAEPVVPEVAAIAPVEPPTTEAAATPTAPVVSTTSPTARARTAKPVSADAPVPSDPSDLEVEAADEAHAAPLEEAVVEALPESLEREEVIEGIELLRNEYKNCAGDLHGTAEMRITIANTGRITHAVVAGDYAGTPQGSCLARTLRQARFRSFVQPRLDIFYPMAL